MALITINIFSKSNMYPFIFAIFWYIRQKVQISNFNDKVNDICYYLLFIYFSEIIAIFGYFIIKYRTKNNDSNIEKTNNNIALMNEIEYIYIERLNILKDQKINLFFFILFSFILDIFVTLILSYKINYSKESNFEVYCRPFQIIINSILSLIFLKIKIFSHQKLSIILILFSGIFIFLSENSFSSDILLILLQYFIGFIISGLLDIIETKTLILISPYLLLFFKGMIGLIGVILFSLIKGNFIILITFLRSSLNLLLITFIISSMIFNIFFELTLQFLTPNHICIGDCLSSILLFIIDDLKKGNNILKIIGYLFLIFGCLIFNEFIILYFCNLEENTKYEISKRCNESYNNIQNEDQDNNTLYNE